MRKLWQKRKRWLWPVFYGAFILLWLAVGLVNLVGDRLSAEAALGLEKAQAVNMGQVAPGQFYTENNDPQLIFADVNTPLRQVAVKATFEKPAGELELFYTRKPEDDFSAARRVIGVPMEDGSILYTLPAGQVHSLRIDAGTEAGNTVVIEGITLNPHLPAGHYLLPNLRAVLLLMVAPALALCTIYTIIECIWAARVFFASRKKKEPA